MKVEKVTGDDGTKVFIQAPVWTPNGDAWIARIELTVGDGKTKRFEWTNQESQVGWHPYTHDSFPAGSVNTGDFRISANHSHTLHIENGVPSREGFPESSMCHSNGSFVIKDTTFSPQRFSTYVILTPDIIIEFTNNSGGKIWIWRREVW